MTDSKATQTHFDFDPIESAAIAAPDVLRRGGRAADRGQGDAGSQRSVGSGGSQEGARAGAVTSERAVWGKATGVPSVSWKK